MQDKKFISRIYLYCFLLLLFSNYLHAQKYRIVFTASVQAEPCDPDPIRNSSDILRLENRSLGRSVTLALASCADLFDSHVNTVRFIDFLPNAISRKRYAETTSGSVVVDDFQRVNVSFAHCDSKTISLSTFSDSVKIQIEPYVDITTRPSNNAVCEIDLEADVQGFAPEVYVWQFYDQFSTATNKWTNFPSSLQGIYKVSFKIDELVGNRAEQFDGTTMQFRLKKYCSKYTPPVIYSIIACSPELVGPILPSQTRCNYSNEGRFIMTVNRDLFADEKIVVSLYVQNVINPSQYDFLTQEVSNNLIQISSEKYNFSWQGNVSSGNYKVKYQTIKGNGTIPETDPSWATLEFSPTFIISKSNGFNYSVEVLKNETCKSEYDGEIKLQVTGGESGRNYSYIVYKVDGSNVTVHKNWTVFSGLNTTVSSLGKDTYRLQIRDNQGCYAR